MEIRKKYLKRKGERTMEEIKLEREKGYKLAKYQDIIAFFNRFLGWSISLLILFQFIVWIVNSFVDCWDSCYTPPFFNGWIILGTFIVVAIYTYIDFYFDIKEIRTVRYIFNLKEKTLNYSYERFTKVQESIRLQIINDVLIGQSVTEKICGLFHLKIVQRNYVYTIGWVSGEEANRVKTTIEKYNKKARSKNYMQVDLINQRGEE